MCPKILFLKSLTGLKIGRDTRLWLENRREGLRGGRGTDGRRKAVKEIGRAKKEKSDEAIQKSALERKG